MKRKLTYFFAALLLSGVAAFGIGCSPACEGLANAAIQVCLNNPHSDACEQRNDQLVKHGCIQ